MAAMTVEQALAAVEALGHDLEVLSSAFPSKAYGRDAKAVFCLISISRSEMADAKRYRWLASVMNQQLSPAMSDVLAAFHANDKSRLDAAIDVAMGDQP